MSKRIELDKCTKCGRYPVMRFMELEGQPAVYYQCGCKTSKRYIVHRRGSMETPEMPGDAVRKAAISWMAK